MLKQRKPIEYKVPERCCHDSAYFLKEGKLIESFEALIWAWAYVTIGKDLGVLKSMA